MRNTDMFDTYPQAEALLRRLQHSPQVFAQPAPAVERLQTHISWLLLAGEHVYKFKKPLQLDFLDFSTAALRRAACEEELRINRRTAPQLYLGVVAVVAAGDGLRVLPADEADAGGATVLAHAVHMRRFPQDALLSQVLAQGRLLPAHIDALARHVAAFHAAAAAAAPQQGWGTASAVRAPVDECLSALQAMAAAALSVLAPAVAVVARWCAVQGAALASVFDARLQQGRVRECHGDLHLGNLVLLGGQPQLFDAIEFNPALRWIDTVADGAFLFMDLHAHGRADLGWRFLNAWLERTGDYAGLQVLAYYCVYRALVRARVAGLRLAQIAPAEDAARAACLQEVQRYVQLAVRFTESRPRWLGLAHGFSGAGKTYQSQALIAQRGMVRVRADVERKRLFGLAPEGASAGVPGGIYTPAATERAYARLAELAQQALTAGYPVLVDATLLDQARRARFIALADALQLPWRILAFEAPVKVLRARVRNRQQAGSDASEATLAVLQAQLASAQPLTAAEEAHTVHIDTTRAVDWNVLLTSSDVPAADTAARPS